ncbi:MAG: GNAT family N-acetyltransferase [Candidatus Diapherotrites archaeon]|nr:GNAT family N-acetyltransferase [Candidatus Diapherotrites archaeon]
MYVRGATEQDVPAIAALGVELTALESQWDPLLIDREENEKIYPKYFLRKLRNEKVTIFVAEENNELIGFVMGEDERLRDPFKEKKIGYLADLFVAEEHRGKGIGKALLDAMTDWFASRGLRIMSLTAYTQNKEAEEFYLANGFEKTVVYYRRPVTPRS